MNGLPPIGGFVWYKKGVSSSWGLNSWYRFEKCRYQQLCGGISKDIPCGLVRIEI